MDVVPIMMSLGFTDLEARAYVALIGADGDTGYAVAKRIGRPTANTYKALASLQGKGAVLVSSGKSRRYRAVPVDTLVESLGRKFQADQDRLIDAIEQLDTDAPAPGTYSLETPDHVLYSARKLISAASTRLFIDVTPWVLGNLRESIVVAVASGVETVVKCTDDVAIAGATILREQRESAVERISVVADGNEYLEAVLAGGGTEVLQSVWVVGPHLCHRFTRLLIGDMFYCAVSGGLDSGLSTDELEELFDRYASLMS
jgi:sugar-specific transcriptional regulator TrmB